MVNRKFGEASKSLKILWPWLWQYQLHQLWREIQLKKILNVDGIRTEPCRTQKADQSLHEELTLVLCFLFDIWSCINFKVGKLNSYAFNFAIRSSWSRQLNASDNRLIKHQRFYFVELIFSIFRFSFLYSHWLLSRRR